MTLVPFRRQTPRRSRQNVASFDDIFDSFFNNALSHLGTPTPSVSDMVIQTNVSETEKAYHIQAELPDVKEDDIELTVDDGILTLTGEKQEEETEDGQTFHRVERRYGEFQRSWQLPSDADEETVSATMKNGVLTIDIAKARDAQKEARRIRVKAS